MLLVGWVFLLPRLRAPGRGVPGFLAGLVLVFRCCFSSMIQFSFSNFAPGSLTFHSAQRAPPQFENHVQIFHLLSTDDELTGPDNMNQLACEQKKAIWPLLAHLSAAKTMSLLTLSKAMSLLTLSGNANACGCSFFFCSQANWFM